MSIRSGIYRGINLVVSSILAPNASSGPINQGIALIPKIIHDSLAENQFNHRFTHAGILRALTWPCFFLSTVLGSLVMQPAFLKAGFRAGS